MIRTQILRVRRERDMALLEAMLLASLEDGSLAEAKKQRVLDAALQCLEFERERPEVVREWIRQGARRLLQRSEESFFSSLRERLPAPHNRLLAYGLAVKASSAQAEPREIGLLARLQEELGVTASQARVVCSGLARGVSPSELVAEPPARTRARMLETVLMVAGLDASLTEAEVAALHRAQEDVPDFLELVQQQLRRLAFGSLAEDPMEAVRRQLELLALVPAPISQRRDAWLLASRFSHALGRNLFQELLLAFMQELLGLEDEILPPGSTTGESE